MSVGHTTTLRTCCYCGHEHEKEACMNPGASAVRRQQLPTKHASPRRLSEELKALLGQDTDFNVEVHHNVYMIESNQDFDIRTLYLNCRRARCGRGNCDDSSSTSSDSD